MSERNWQEMGLSWTTVPVREQAGDHATDRIGAGYAEVPVVTDVAKFVAHFGEPRALAIFNRANSLRVAAQSIARGSKDSAETLREKMYNSLIGVRNAGARPTVTVHNLPDGTMYAGSDEMEYRQAFVAILVDLGVDVAKATSMAQLAKW
jgi:hypothetical protein